MQLSVYTSKYACIVARETFYGPSKHHGICVLVPMLLGPFSCSAISTASWKSTEDDGHQSALSCWLSDPATTLFQLLVLLLHHHRASLG